MNIIKRTGNRFSAMDPDFPPPMIDPLAKFALFTNGKCANTTQKHWFLGSRPLRDLFMGHTKHHSFRQHSWSLNRSKMRRLIQRYDADATNARVRRVITQYRNWIAPHLLAHASFTEFRKVMVTRDPASRTLSAYLDKFCGEDHELPWVKHVVTATQKDSPSFVDFLDYLEATRPEKMNGHWRPQTFTVRGVQGVHFIKLSEMATQLPKTLDPTGLRDNEILKSKSQANRYLAEDVDGAMHLTAARLRTRLANRGGHPTASSFMSPEIERRIRSIFAEDYDRLGY